MRPALLSASPLLAAAALLLAPGRSSAAPVVLTFDEVPGPPWETWDCGVPGQASVAGGVLTIETPSCFEFSLQGPSGEWHQQVSNSNGWMIETRLRLDPTSEEIDDGAVLLWIHDHKNLVVIGFDHGEVRLQYPDHAPWAMDTTDDFHVYRVVSVLDDLWVYVDGVLRIEHHFSWQGAGTESLTFGDGNGAGYSLSYWDYLWYDVAGCSEGQCAPDGTCEDGAPCPGGTCEGGTCVPAPGGTGGSGGVTSSATSGGAAPGAPASEDVPPLYGRGCTCATPEPERGAPGGLGLLVAALALSARRSRGRAP